MPDLRIDLGGVDRRRTQAHRPVRDDVGRVERIAVRLGAVSAVVHIVDQALVERPGVHLALPVVDDRVAEPEYLRLLVRSEERRVGEECYVTGRSGWYPYL